MDFSKREQRIQWLLAFTKKLLEKAVDAQNASLIIYAALECRNMLEKIEFDLLLVTNDNKDRNELVEVAKGKRGLSKANNDYKTLKYKYQVFFSAFMEAFQFPLPIKPFDFKQSEQIQASLGDYVHIYTKLTPDFDFNSKFVNDGLALISDAIHFIEDFCLKEDENGGTSITYGGLKLSSMPLEMAKLYDNWKNSAGTGVEAERQLREQIETIIKNEPKVDWNKELFNKKTT